MKSKSTFKLLQLFSIIMLLAVVPPAVAQTNSKGKQVEAMIKNQEFVFKAQTASPMRGRTMQLTAAYDVLVNKDSVRTYLPYFGRAYMAQSYSGDGGIKLTATDFSYDVSNKKKKRWNVNIVPADRSSVQQLLFSISENGYASLQVISTNRDPITFNGYIESRK